ncbi:UbiA family prenyltransferase [Aspergillus melleus]|uniref:UbiA family prenyltransferase n=1 Tax=Aspergillus melleus TaxID=138277 RepID=UPI001E8E9B20|nr:uncharacterized protein LDX57_002583 [Aspergillus melleus]KAH8424840.1 hypothetical protein LDX57_002583 [Aspergillus melleus]
MQIQCRFMWTTIPSLVWGFTQSDFPTFVLPNASFGIFAALVAPAFTSCTEIPNPWALLVRAAPAAIIFNWANLLVFDIANQRLLESIREDSLNKPWRPLPRGLIDPNETRRLLLGAVPIVLALSAALGVWEESALILILTWMYNDLGGGDELTRDIMIAIAYDVFLFGSLRIALATTTSCANISLSATGFRWLGIIAGVIMSTMQIQDLRDQAGDRTRGRKTWPLVVGDMASRAWIATCVMFWSFACIEFWDVPLWCLLGRSCWERGLELASC